MDAKILVCLPTAEFARQAKFYDYLFPALQIGAAQGHVKQFIGLHGQSPARNRNIAIEMAIEQDFTHIFFIDDDVIIPHDCIARLLVHDKDMVSGTYRMRSYPHQIIGFVSTDEIGGSVHIYPEHNQTGLVKITTGGLGCCLIKTDVFRAMLPDCKIQGNNCHDWIRLGEMQTDHWCDDLGFFMRAAKHGFELWLDLDLNCGHMATVTVWPDRIDGKYIVKYDSNGTQSVAFPAPALSELMAATK